MKTRRRLSISIGLFLCSAPLTLCGLEGTIKGKTYSTDRFQISMPRMAYHTGTTDRVDGSYYEVCFQGEAGDFVRYEVICMDDQKQLVQKIAASPATGYSKLFERCVVGPIGKEHPNAQVLSRTMTEDGYFGLLMIADDPAQPIYRGYLVSCMDTQLVMISTQLPVMMERAWKNFPDEAKMDRRATVLGQQLKNARLRFAQVP